MREEISLEEMRKDFLEILGTDRYMGRVLESLIEKKTGQENLFCSEREGWMYLAVLKDRIYHGKSPYTTWIKRTAEKERVLNIPIKQLRGWFEDYILPCVGHMKVHESCHGGEKGWSPKRSLENHLPCNEVLSFDLKSAFENINIRNVFELFYGLFSPNEGDLGKKLASFFSILCTVNYPSGKRGLPQGSPCSMSIFNRMMFRMDNHLSTCASEKSMRYTRWVDDITISSYDPKGIEKFLGAVGITENYAPVAVDKTFFQDSQTTIYLLGHKIIGGRDIKKNSKEERILYKAMPLDFKEWFGENKTKDYEEW